MMFQLFNFRQPAWDSAQYFSFQAILREPNCRGLVPAILGQIWWRDALHQGKSRSPSRHPFFIILETKRDGITVIFKEF